MEINSEIQGKANREASRLAQQRAFDAAIPPLAKNQMGQFATPPGLANAIMRRALSLHNEGTIRFLEPSIGTGSFYSSLVSNVPISRIQLATGIEIDDHLARIAEELWSDLGLRIFTGNFLEVRAQLDAIYTLVVANPPYSRHHHLPPSIKSIFRRELEVERQTSISGMSGLHVYFMLACHSLMSENAVGAWLIPAEFMDANYGSAIKSYLLNDVTLLHVHKFEANDLQFSDALVTSAVVFFKKKKATNPHEVIFSKGPNIFTEGGKLVSSMDLSPSKKWSRAYDEEINEEPSVRLGELFRIKRGLATGANKYFIMPLEEAKSRGFRTEMLQPIIPSPRKLLDEVIERTVSGTPDTSQSLVLLGSHLPMTELRALDPALADYFTAIEPDVTSRHLVSRRTPWYRQESRIPAPFMVTYMGRSSTGSQSLRVIRNESDAVATNMYLMMYPRDELAGFLARTPESVQQVHQALKRVLETSRSSDGRVYGGGMRKIEPRELAALDATPIIDLVRNGKMHPPRDLPLTLF